VKKGLLTLGAICMMIVLSGTLFAVGTTPAKTAGTIDSVIQAAEKAGLKNVRSIDLEDGQWELKTQNEGEQTKYNFNQQESKLIEGVKKARKGIVSPSADLTSLQNAVKAVQAQEESFDIKAIKFVRGNWEVIADDSKGKECKLIVKNQTNSK
jgi:hypothetical protein